MSIPSYVKGFKIGKLVGQGTFGDIYEAKDECGRKAVVKIASYGHEADLHREGEVYRALGGKKIFAKIYHDVVINGQQFIVMERLKEDLEGMMKRLRKSRRSISLKSVFDIGIQLIYAVQHIHEAGYLHLDIKPNNIMVDATDKHELGRVVLIDLGACQKYMRHGQHVKQKAARQAGTPLFGSIFFHQGLTQGRGCDLEAVMYTLVYLFKRRLPWDEYSSMGGMLESKLNTTAAELFKDMTESGLKFAIEVKRTSFSQKPDYRKLRKLLASAIDEIRRKER